MHFNNILMTEMKSLTLFLKLFFKKQELKIYTYQMLRNVSNSDQKF